MISTVPSVDHILRQTDRVIFAKVLNIDEHSEIGFYDSTVIIAVFPHQRSNKEDHGRWYVLCFHFYGSTHDKLFGKQFDKVKHTMDFGHSVRRVEAVKLFPEVDVRGLEYIE